MNILVVDDERNIRESVRRVLELEGFDVETAENGLSARRKMDDGEFDLVLSDQRMPGMTGLELLSTVRADRRRCPFVIMSAYGEISDAVEAMKRGCRDYIAKPFDPDVLVDKVRMITREPSSLTPDGGDTLIGDGPVMRKAKQRLARISATDSTVLITGESGTGKEVCALNVHAASASAKGPFVGINIGGIHENLLESELFGHEKGAFTGADRRKIGLFETARGGTLFLDEVGDTPPAVQVKLLRVLQERCIRRLGSNEEIPIDVRIIAATNRNLEEDVKQGTFREDLYYRLNVARLHLPALRDRREDIPALSGFFIGKLNRRMNRQIRGLSAEAADRLATWPFPGNIRELENLLERAMIYADSDLLEADDLDLPETGGNAPPFPEAGSLKDLERRAIRTALIRWEGNRTRAAEELGISRRTILNKIGEFGLK